MCTVRTTAASTVRKHVGSSLAEVPRPVLAVVPVRARDLTKTGGMPVLGNRPLMAFTTDAVRGAATIDRVVVSAFSAGYGAIRALLREPRHRSRRA